MPKPIEFLKKAVNPQTFRTGVAVLGTLGVGAAGAFNPAVFDTIGATNSVTSLILGGIYLLLKLFNGEKHGQ
jgi:hypothetical protein